jgi:homoserine kinase type II
MTILTNLDDEALAEIVLAYGFKGLVSVIGIADGNTETTFLFRMASGEAIVTLFESKVDSLDLERAFTIMERLSAAGFACPRPIRDKFGHATIRAAGKLVAAVSFLPGVTGSATSMERCVDLGRNMAQIHVLLPSRPPLEGSSLERGYIHGALRPGNVFFLEDWVTGVINFRLVREDFFVAELADVIAHWTMEKDGSLKEAYAQAVLDGYCDIRPLAEDDFAALPAFTFTSAARLFAIRDRKNLPEGPARTMECASALQLPSRK